MILLYDIDIHSDECTKVQTTSIYVYNNYYYDDNNLIMKFIYKLTLSNFF